MLVHSISPVLSLSDASLFTNNVGANIQDIGQRIDSSISDQLGLPLVDFGSLVFFSGNIIADLILNFLLAVPGMINVIFSAFFLFFPVNAVLQQDFKLFITVFGAILYIISTMAFLAGARLGSGNNGI